MIKYEICSTKQLVLVDEDNIYITENNIQSFYFVLPKTFGDYSVSELNFELRVYLSDEDYVSYPLSTTDGNIAKAPITNDITEKPQTVKIIVFATKDGNVIGKTNSVEKEILDAPTKGNKLTPREQFDKTIEKQAATILEQEGTITTQGERITELDGQVAEFTEQVGDLTERNEFLESQHLTDIATIDALSKRKEPIKLQAKIAQPETFSQLIEADPDKDGLSSVTIMPTGDRFIPRAQYDTEISQLNDEIDSQSTTIRKLNKGIYDIIYSQDLKKSDKYIYEDLFDGAFEIEGQFVDDVFYDSEDKVVVDAENNILIPPTAQAYHSSYTGSDIDAFVDGVAEIIRRIGGND